MKILNIFCIILFIVAAALQYNDPDPYIWIIIYLYAALLCYLAIKKIYNQLAYISGLTVYVIYAAYLLFDKNGMISWIKDHQAESIVQSMQATKPWIEETRELFGLLILIAVLTANMIWLSRKQRLNNQV